MVAKHEIREYGNTVNVCIAKYNPPGNALHWHYDCELIYAVKGCMEIYANGENHVLKAGQAMYIGNMEEHRINANPGVEVCMFFFSYDILNGLIKGQRLKTPILHNEYDLLSLYEKIKDEFVKKEKYYERVIENLMNDIVIKIFRNEEVAKNEIKKKDKKAFMQLLDAIETDYCYYTGADAAKFLHLSRAYFSKYFHTMSGLVFTDYLNAVRISKAVKMLQTDKERTISEIASLCGFNTIRNFNRAFKMLTGFSPKEIPADYIFEDAVFFSASSTAAGFNPTLREAVLTEAFGAGKTY